MTNLDLTDEEISYLLIFGFEPVVKVKVSDDNQTFTVDTYIPTR